jgi:hypothetical protein
MTKTIIQFVNKLNDSMGDYQIRNQEKDIALDKKRSIFIKIKLLFNGIKDAVLLLLRLNSIRKNKTSVYYTHTTFIRGSQNKFEDVLYKDVLSKENSIFVSYDRSNYYHKINDIKVYNLGIIVKVLQKLKVIKRTTGQINFNDWLFVNGIICRKLNGNEVYIPSYSNDTGLSLVFNKYRANFKLIEVQHTSVINYPPYSFISELKLADEFYYRDERSRIFLENNLFAKVPAILKPLETQLIKLQPATQRKEILYISSFEFSTLHPVFEEFLKGHPLKYYIKVRLHPRQSSLEDQFNARLNELGCEFEIQKTKMWYDLIPENAIVVSGLSSVIEEAVKSNLKSVIIDPAGAKRFDYLIDNKLCFYSDNLAELLAD